MAAAVRHLKIFSQGRACTAKRTLDGHQKSTLGKRLRASFLPLTSWDLTRFCGASCGRLPRSWSTRDGSFHLLEPLSRRLSAMSSAMRSRPSRYAVSFAQPWPRGLPWLRAPAKGGSGGWKDRGLCNCVVWRCIVGIVGIDLIRFEDRLTDVYEGYESICLLTAESKYVPSSHVTVLLTRFNDLLKLFCLTYGLWTSRIVSLKLIRGLIIPRIQNEASWLFPDMRASASV